MLAPHERGDDVRELQGSVHLEGTAASLIAERLYRVGLCLLHGSSAQGDRRARSWGTGRPRRDARHPELNC
ncbi:hypothetical protein BCAR13_860069 [Paraburkholderia caribensis]|nr:hypothetical protein BCAR13_860069 [Paraburkholderia caribensis]